jgi:parallel beta-helix repeat protein
MVLVSACGTSTKSVTVVPDGGSAADAAMAGEAGPADTTSADATPTDTGGVDSSIAIEARPVDTVGVDARPADVASIDAPSAVEAKPADAARVDVKTTDTAMIDAPASETKPVDTASTDAQPGAIGTWTDTPGECPAGFTRIDVTSLADLQSAARAEGAHASDPADACYLIHDAVYTQKGSTLPFYVSKGGTSASRPRIFLGQSRAGTIIRGRGSLADGVSHVVIQNLTFDLNGYSQSGSFNTLDLPQVDDVLVSHVTFTGDCQTGANGGHIEFTGAKNTVIDSCLIEKFGRCGPNGHQEHGIYIADAMNITIRNCEIRGNASRGIQLYTDGGNYGSVDGVLIEHNRIHDNGHAEYEDGIAFNGSGTGTISNVTVEHNLIYANYYSGIRTVDTAYTNVVVSKNTFYRNGMLSSGSGRGEIVLDDSGAGANQSFTRNILFAGAQVSNGCSAAAARNYRLTDNVVQGTVPSGASCMTGNVVLDPMFLDPAAADFHTSNPAAAAYGAYAP